MTESKKHTYLDLTADAPELSTQYWKEKFATAKLQLGRPKADVTKVSTIARLSSEVIEHFKSGGPGWQ